MELPAKSAEFVNNVTSNRDALRNEWNALTMYIVNSDKRRAIPLIRSLWDTFASKEIFCAQKCLALEVLEHCVLLSTVYMNLVAEMGVLTKMEEVAKRKALRAERKRSASYFPPGVNQEEVTQCIELACKILQQWGQRNASNNTRVGQRYHRVLQKLIRAGATVEDNGKWGLTVGPVVNGTPIASEQMNGIASNAIASATPAVSAAPMPPADSSQPLRGIGSVPMQIESRKGDEIAIAEGVMANRGVTEGNLASEIEARNSQDTGVSFSDEHDAIHLVETQLIEALNDAELMKEMLNESGEGKKDILEECAQQCRTHLNMLRRLDAAVGEDTDFQNIQQVHKIFEAVSSAIVEYEKWEAQMKKEMVKVERTPSFSFIDVEGTGEYTVLKGPGMQEVVPPMVVALSEQIERNKAEEAVVSKGVKTELTDGVPVVSEASALSASLAPLMDTDVEVAVVPDTVKLAEVTVAELATVEKAELATVEKAELATVEKAELATVAVASIAVSDVGATKALPKQTTKKSATAVGTKERPEWKLDEAESKEASLDANVMGASAFEAVSSPFVGFEIDSQLATEPYPVGESVAKRLDAVSPAAAKATDAKADRSKGTRPSVRKDKDKELSKVQEKNRLLQEQFGRLQDTHLELERKVNMLYDDLELRRKEILSLEAQLKKKEALLKAKSANQSAQDASERRIAELESQLMILKRQLREAENTPPRVVTSVLPPVVPVHGRMVPIAHPSSYSIYLDSSTPPLSPSARNRSIHPTVSSKESVVDRTKVRSIAVSKELALVQKSTVGNGVKDTSHVKGILAPTTSTPLEASKSDTFTNLLWKESEVEYLNRYEIISAKEQRNLRRFVDLLAVNDAALFEDDNLQIGMKARYGNGRGKVVLFVGNKRPLVLQNIVTSFLCSEDDALTFQVSSIPSIIRNHQQVHQEMLLECLAPFDQFPIFRFECILPDATPYKLDLFLPIVISKFMDPVVLNKKAFFSYWNSAAFLKSTSTAYIELNNSLRDTYSKVVKICQLGGAFAICPEVDTVADNIVLFGTLKVAAVALSGLPVVYNVGARVEFGVGAFHGKVRLTIASESKLLTQGIRHLLRMALSDISKRYQTR